MLRVAIAVKSCGECPKRQYASGGRYECTAVGELLVQGESMPVWCPLPADQAALAARARSALTSVDAVVIAALEAVEKGDLARAKEMLALSKEYVARGLHAS